MLLTYTQKIHTRALYLALVLFGLLFWTTIPSYAQSNGYSLSVSSTTIKAGEQVTLSWNVSSGNPRTNKDWIGVSNITGSEPVWTDSWTYTNGTATGNFAVTFTQPGKYQFQYLLNDSYQSAAQSSVITVTANGAGYSLSVSSTTVKTGEQVTLNWSVGSGSPITNKDWIGVSNVTGTQPVWTDFWTYTNGTATGTFNVKFTQPGKYQFQYLLNDSYQSAGQSSVVTVTGNSTGPSLPDTIRFLNQSSWGPNEALISHVRQIGFESYLDEQFNNPGSFLSEIESRPTTIPADCPGNSACRRDFYSMYPIQRWFFHNALYGDDQLRQRVAFALHKIIVVSGIDIQQPAWYREYYKILYENAFGNYRKILEDITYNPAMGLYLDTINNNKSNPNENYAREILQLFSIGLFELNHDGTYKLDKEGNLIDTYGQDEILAFSRVFTGLILAAPTTPGITNYVAPMRVSENNHDKNEKRLLNGVVLPAGQTTRQDISQAIENIFNHPNVAPFICKQLIQQLVTSNPSPAYVSRIADVFDNNGSGVRGDLKAVVKAILLDPEARGDQKTDEKYGKLSEPALLLTNVLRAFEAKSYDLSGQSDGVMLGGGVSNILTNTGQTVPNPPTVFSYFAPDYVIPGTDLLGPEFNILSTSSSFARYNMLQTLIFNGLAPAAGIVGEGEPSRPVGTALDIQKYIDMANEPAQLVESLNMLLLHGTMSNAYRTAVEDAVRAVSAQNLKLRAQTAIYLVATSSQYQVKR
jgi:uncharacterized protein (DUF1800 family)/plastocyanin